MSDSPTVNTRKFAAMRANTTAAQMRAKAAVEIREKQTADEVSFSFSTFLIPDLFPQSSSIHFLHFFFIFLLLLSSSFFLLLLM